MKKMIFFVLILFVSSANLKAQWSVTPEVGVASIKSNGFGDNDWIFGIKAGLGLGYQFNTSMSVKSGLYYAQSGYSLDKINKIGGEYYVDNLDIKLRRNFLQIPFMFNYSCPLSKNVLLNFAAGPYIALSVKDDWKGSALVETYMPEMKDCRKFDWGISASTGIEINKRWVINLNYDLSLGEEYPNDGLNANYHTVSLSVGYKFSLK